MKQNADTFVDTETRERYFKAIKEAFAPAKDG